MLISICTITYGFGFNRKGCFSVIYKCSGSYKNFSDPYSNLCIPDVIKNINIKGFNLMSRTNETRNKKQKFYVYVDKMEVFVIINKDGMKINTNVNARKWLKKE